MCRNLLPCTVKVSELNKQYFVSHEMWHFTQFSVPAREPCTLGCVNLDCNGTKCTGNALSIPAPAFSHQILGEAKFCQVAISFLAWSFQLMIWMYLWQIWLYTMLWLTCTDFQVEFWSFSVRNCVQYEGIWIAVWCPCTANVHISDRCTSNVKHSSKYFLQKLCKMWWNVGVMISFTWNVAFHAVPSVPYTFWQIYFMLKQ